MTAGIEAELKTFERAALAVGRFVNEPVLSKRLQYGFIRNLAYAWMRPAMERRTYADNVDWLIPAPSDRGVLFACNHRSFFDAYLYLFTLYRSGAKWPRNLYFPVRSDFFYDSPLGVMVNMAICGGMMYPPIYRDQSKRQLNTDALARIATFLDTPHSLVGMHPEGTRNKGDDPYALLPAQPGVGQIVLKSNPMVIPVFVNGLSNDFLGAIRTSFEPGARRREPIVVVFGDPVDYSEYTTSKPRAALYKKCSDKILAAIAQCGRRERQLREDITSGTIADDDPQWLWQSPKS